jgi:SAM-dependent methyltransferase
MPLISEYARRRKINFFLEPLPKEARILEIGSGSGWVGEYLRANGWKHFVGLDLQPSANVDIVGDIKNWQTLGLEPESFDVIIAFEVVEHVDCFAECQALLRPGGLLLATSPVPHMDWFLKLLEWCGLNQKRTSPHDHLLYFNQVEIFAEKRLSVKAGLSQWGIFSKNALHIAAERKRGSSRVNVLEQGAFS